MQIRKADKKDIPKIDLLNGDEVPHVTNIKKRDWLHFLEIASHFVVIEHEGEIVGFMVTLREKQEYESMNYQFFLNHYKKFEYVDRIVVSKNNQGNGLGRKLYEYLFDRNETGITTCEVNIKPENPDSLAFHAKMGFKEKSRLITDGGNKIVSLLVRKSG